MGFKADMSGAVAKIQAICTNGAVGKAAATSAARHMEQYVPRLTGQLRNSVHVKPFHVVYKAPYAHYQWEGKNITHRTTPGTTSHWEKQANKTDIAKDITAAIKRL